MDTHPDELNEEQWRALKAKERGEDYVHPEDHAPGELRLANARLAIFHELHPGDVIIWNNCVRSIQNEYARLMVEGMPSGTAAKRFQVEHCA